MEPNYAVAIANDEAEVHRLARRLAIRAKLFWYSFSRPVMNFLLKRRLLALAPRLASDPVFKRVNLFLNGDGGMFKQHVYRLCDRLRPLRGSRVLVPGIGYCKNLLQLAAWRPKEIVAFDLYEYPEVWPVMVKKVKEQFGVDVSFYKGDFDALPAAKLGKFDFVISDAVLEHVPDLPKFAAGSYEFLNPGGVFYASFGPLWYGPCGDHVTWGEDQLFDHLLLPKEEYDKQLRASEMKASDQDSCDPGFMIREKLFSYLHANQYLEEMDKAGFKTLQLYSKVQPLSLKLLRKRPDVAAALDAKGEPAFDRFSGGLYIWAQKP
jgi:SAM-dependent methyltransferase